MEEKYFIDIDKSRRILGRYTLSIHGENLPVSSIEVSKDVFENSIQKNHNYLNEDLVTEMKELRDPIEIKQAKINEINSKAYSDITTVYPDWKQANITADYLQYPDNEIFKKNFEDMRLYINQVRANADYEVILLG